MILQRPRLPLPGAIAAAQPFLQLARGLFEVAALTGATRAHQRGELLVALCLFVLMRKDDTPIKSYG